MQLDLLYFLVWLFSSIRIICPLPYRRAVRQIIPCVLPFSSNALQLIKKKKKNSKRYCCICNHFVLIIVAYLPYIHYKMNKKTKHIVKTSNGGPILTKVTTCNI